MYLKSLALENFRNFAQQKFDFNQAVTVVVGDNGVGKTSILEAIMLFATGKSFRAGKAEEMISFDQAYARLEAVLVESEETNSTLNTPENLAGLDELKLNLLINPGQIQGQRTSKLLFRVNDLKRSRKFFLGNLTAVIFRPEDMRLVEGSPTRRRAFLDEVLSQIDPEYQHSLSVYEQALRRFNKLLLQIKDRQVPESTLTYWNLTLLKHGLKLQDLRQQFLQFCQTVSFPFNFQAVYLPSIISQERLAQYQPRAIAAGHSLIGPQKDDFIVNFDKIGNRDVAIYGSRGQQRMAVLWLKVCSLAFLAQQQHQQPVLLLDDIFSELDEQVCQLILPIIKQHQTFITTTHEELLKTVLGENLLQRQIYYLNQK